MSGLLTKVANTGWLGLEQGVRLGLALVVVTLVARHLGPGDFGAYAYIFGLVALATPLVRLGLDGVFISRVAADPSSAPALLSIIVPLSLSAALIASLLCIAFVFLAKGPPGVSAMAMTVACVAIFASSTEYFAFWLKVREQVALISVLRIAIMAIGAGTALVLVANNAGFADFVTLRSVEILAVGLAGIAAVRLLRRTRSDAAPEQIDIRALLGDALPLFLAGLATVGFTRLDQIMLGLMAPSEELGAYAVAARIADTAALVPMVIQGTMFAAMSRNFHSDPKSFDDYMQRIYDLSALLAWPIVGALALVAVFLVEPLLGSEFRTSISMILILLAGLPFFFLYYAWGSMLTIRNWYWLIPAVTGLGACVNVVLNLLLIPAYGGRGAAVATVAAFFMASIGGSLLFRRLRPAARSMVRALDPIGSCRRALSVWRAIRVK